MLGFTPFLVLGESELAGLLKIPFLLGLLKEPLGRLSVDSLSLILLLENSLIGLCEPWAATAPSLIYRAIFLYLSRLGETRTLPEVESFLRTNPYCSAGVGPVSSWSEDALLWDDDEDSISSASSLSKGSSLRLRRCYTGALDCPRFLFVIYLRSYLYWLCSVNACIGAVPIC